MRRCKKTAHSPSGDPPTTNLRTDLVFVVRKTQSAVFCGAGSTTGREQWKLCQYKYRVSNRGKKHQIHPSEDSWGFCWQISFIMLLV